MPKEHMKITLSIEEAQKDLEYYFKGLVTERPLEVLIEVQNKDPWIIPDEILKCLADHGHKIPAIKLARDSYPTMSLADAKRYVEDLMANKVP